MKRASICSLQNNIHSVQLGFSGNLATFQLCDFLKFVVHPVTNLISKCTTEHTSQNNKRLEIIPTVLTSPAKVRGTYLLFWEVMQGYHKNTMSL